MPRFSTCVRVLDDELGTTPSRETTALFEQIKTGVFRPRANSPVALPLPVAERRQLTLLACQIGGLLTLGEQLELDALSDLMNVLHQTCAEVAGPFGGRIAEQRSDSVVIAFGFAKDCNAPLAAVRAAIVLENALHQFTSPIIRAGTLTAQIGIHTGWVNVSDHGAANPLSLGIVGLPLIAVNRLQTLAAPASILISATTERCLRGRITRRTLGTHTFDELRQPLAIFQVLQLHDAPGYRATVKVQGAAQATTVNKGCAVQRHEEDIFHPTSA